jgi:predicted dehydrogenase
MTYRVGIIGCGRKGTQHARAWNLNPKAEVVAAADTDAENLELFRRRFDVPVYSDYREMMNNHGIDIAAPILPVKTNADVVLECTEFDIRGIFCEQPITDSLENADRMVTACRAKSVKFGCGDLDRNLPDYWKAKAIIDSGQLGEVVGIDVHGGSSVGWDIQGLSLCRLFAGDVEAAWAIGWVTGDPHSDEDQGQAGYIRFVNGVEAFRHTRVNAKRGIEVHCTKGLFHTDYGYLRMWRFKDPDDLPGPGRHDAFVEITGLFKEDHQHLGCGMLDAEGWRWPGNRTVASVQSLVDAIENNTEPTGSGENSRKCLEIAVALRESHRRGRTLIQLPMEDRSLKIIPPMSRWLQRKETMSLEDYRKSVGAWRPGDIDEEGLR